MLAWLTIPFTPIIGDGVYHSHSDCEDFINFTLSVDDAPYSYEDGVYTIVDTNGDTFVAQCIHLDDVK